MAKSATSFKRGHQPVGGRPKGSRNSRTLEVRAIARGLLEDSAYQASLRRRLLAGTAPQMETLLYHYAYGKPGERQEVNTSVQVANPAGSELPASAAGHVAHSGRDLIMDGRVVTQEGREKIRRLTDGLIIWANKEGAKEASAGLAGPPAITPPDPPA